MGTPWREIESPEALAAALAAGDLRRCVLHGLDLKDRSAELTRSNLAGAVFIGCALAPGVRAEIEARGALVFPRVEGLPYQPFRTRLYAPGELYGGWRPEDPGSAGRTLDARIYRHYVETGGERPDPVESLCRRMHDHAVTEALEAALAGRPAAAVFGGHRLRRDAPEYASAARAARAMARAGLCVITGGGPGAMEAAMLGARLRAKPDAVLDEALAVMASAPGSVPPAVWLGAAWTVRETLLPPEGDPPVALGIPTWRHGHELPTPFPDRIAKYFMAAERQARLTLHAGAGYLFIPGGPGTVREAAEAAELIHYGGPDAGRPLVFLGRDYWRTRIPVEPLLAKQADGAVYGKLIHLTDDAEEAAGFIVRFAQGR